MTITNVVTIIADDLRTDEVWVMPNLNRLARLGTRFTQARVSCAVCTPYRVSVLSGRRASGPNGHGKLGVNYPGAADIADALPLWLADAGWDAAHLGKGLLGFATEMGPHWAHQRSSVKGPGGAATTPNDFGYGIYDGSTTTYPSEGQSAYLTREGLAYLADQLIAGTPTHLHHCAHEVHTPLEGSLRHDGYLAHWERPYVAEDVSDKPSWVQALDEPDSTDVAFMRSWARQRLREAADLDDVVGAYWQLITATGHAEDTVLIVTSDNGDSLLDHRTNALGKGTSYDYALRVPLVAWGGPFTGIGDIDAPVYADVDVTATIVAAAGATPTTATDGQDLADIVASPSAYAARQTLHVNDSAAGGGGGIAGIPRGDTLVDGLTGLKLVRYDGATGTDAHELYDVIADPTELTNLANLPEHAATVAALAADLTAALGGS